MAKARREPAPALAKPSVAGLTRPAGASHFGFNALAGVIGIAFLLWRQSVAPEQAQANGLMTGVVIALLIAAHEILRLKAHRLPSTGLDWDGAFTPSYARIACKLLGLALTLGVIASVYWLLPEYHGSFYQPFWDALTTYGIPLLAMSPAYFWWVDGHQRQPEDAYYHLGRALLHPLAPEARALIKNHFGGWAVKAFFLPLMTVYVGTEVRGFWSAWQAIQAAAAQAGGFWAALTTQKLGFYPYELLYRFTFTVDLLFCVVGYVMTLKVFDSHIRSADPTALGWMVALICYQPFFSLLEAQYLRYEDHIVWGTWLIGAPVIKFFWAVAISVLVSIYCLATVAFGLRFSNLTYRGIITSGPYRYSKHPAYLSKNLSWWLISVPFIAVAPAAALTNCTHLLAINCIYYLRARTEERHLSQDPVYVQYALWINEHGLLARLGRWWPALRYRAA
jgi:protein-S-isoprenylcysteine O-methyltransferase Ste14